MMNNRLINKGLLQELTGCSCLVLMNAGTSVGETLIELAFVKTAFRQHSLLLCYAQKLLKTSLSDKHIYFNDKLNLVTEIKKKKLCNVLNSCENL